MVNRLDVTLLTGLVVIFVQSHMINGEYWYECVEPDAPFPIFVGRDEIDFFTDVFYS